MSFHYILFLATIALLSPSLWAQQPHAVPVQPNDIVYSALMNRLYASVPSAAQSYGDTVTAINPLSGEIGPSIAIGKEPSRLALSEDGRYLYVAFDGTNTIRRIDLTTGEAGPEFGIYLQSGGDPLVVAEMHVLPGRPESVVASLRSSRATGFRHAGIAVFDNGVRRSKVSPASTGANAIHFGSRPDTLWGYDTSNDGFALWRFQVDEEGVTAVGNPVSRLFNCCFNGRIDFSRGLLYTQNGRAYDPEKLFLDGRFYSREVIFATAFAIDPEGGSAYFATRSGYDFILSSFDLQTYRPKGEYREFYSKVGVGFFPTRLIRCGDAGLAVASYESSSIIVLPLSVLRPPAPYERPKPVPLSDGVRRIPLPNNNLVYDSRHGRLYASIAGSIGEIGNSVVAIDPVAGTVGDPVWVGSEPWQLVVSEGADYLYCALYGSNSIRRLVLPDLAPDLRFPVFAERDPPTPTGVIDLLPVPGRPDSVIVARVGGPASVSSGSDGVAVYDAGIKRPASTGSRFDGFPSINSIQLSASRETIYGLNTENTGGEFTNMDLKADGVHLVSIAAGVGAGGSSQLRCQNRLCFTNGGLIIDPEAGLRIDRFPLRDAPFDSLLAWYVLPVLQRGLVYFLLTKESGVDIEAYDVETLQKVGALRVPEVRGEAADLLLWNGDQLAFATANEIVLLPVSLVEIHPVPKPPRSRRRP